MKFFSQKSKIVLLIIGFSLAALIMYFFGYGVMAVRNQSASDTIAQKRVELEVLIREQKSFEQGQKDLAELEKASYPPENLFNNDTKLVTQIQQLESVAQLYGLRMQIAISGSSKTATKVPKTKGELFAVPYTMTLEGDFGSTMKFIQSMEKLPFITNAKTIQVEVTQGENAVTQIGSEFIIKK